MPTDATYSSNKHGYRYEPCKPDSPANQKTEIVEEKLDCGEIVCGSVFIASAFLAHLLTTGVSFTSGVYYVTFLEAFGESSGLTAWIGSLNFGCLCAAGPLASVLMDRFGCSTTLMVGGLLSTCGLVTSAMATNLYTVFITYGILAGLGFGIAFASSISLIACEFNTWRKFAMGVSLSGVGLGTFIQPFLADIFISTYGWRGALVLTSAVTLHTCVLAMIVRVTISIRDAKRRRHVSVTHHELTKDKYICDDVYPEDNKPTLCSFRYIILHINVLLYCFGQSVVYTHIVSYALHQGITFELSSLLVSVIGISNVLGRTLLGIIAQHPAIDVTIMYILCYAVAGVCAFSYSLFPQFVFMLCATSIFGFSIGAYGPLLSEIVCMTSGVAKFARSYGLLMISMALGTLLGAPIAGWLYDATHRYEYSFYLAGTSFIASALAMCIPNIVEKASTKIECLV